MASECSVIFSADEVRAAIEGRKTRHCEPVTDRNSQGNWRASQLELAGAWVDLGSSPAGNPVPYLRAHVTPEAELAVGGAIGERLVDRLYSRVRAGDLIYVKEATQGFRGKARTGGRTLLMSYTADRAPVEVAGVPARWPWGIASRGAYHMPRKYARLWLRVVRVWAERVQDADDASIVAEGIDERVASAAVDHCARRFRTVPEYWISGDDESTPYCRGCAEKEIRRLRREHPGEDYQLDGGWRMESDSSPYCGSCERPLDYLLTEYGCEAELEHFRDHPFDVEDPSSCYALQVMLSSGLWDGVGMPASLRRLARRAVWDTRFAKKGFGWEKDLPIWSFEFERTENGR